MRDRDRGTYLFVREYTALPLLFSALGGSPWVLCPLLVIQLADHCCAFKTAHTRIFWLLHCLGSIVSG